MRKYHSKKTPEIVLQLQTDCMLVGKTLMV
jgi:hypothetical protein